MPDISAIASILTSLKVATDLTKILKEADLSFEAAEWKLKLAGITDALADAKIASAEVKDIISEKDEEIRSLKEALELKTKLTKQGDAYYLIDDDGKPNGDPYCLNCWESKHVLRHLAVASGNIRARQCPSCKNIYNGHYARILTGKE